VQLGSVTPLDAAGAEAPHLEALVLDGGLAGQQQIDGMEPPPTPPVRVAAAEGAAVGLRVPIRCAVVVRIVALRFRLLTPAGPAEQVLPIAEGPDDAIETGTGCAGPAPAP
jgi:hypothetical protein